MLRWLLPAVLLVLSACNKNSELEGFKDIKFGLAKGQLESLGFVCQADGQCKANTTPSQISSIAPEQLATADARRGAVLFTKCAACHTIEEKGANGIGPNLWGVIGRKVADDQANFAFSDGMKQIGGVWDVAALDQFLADPRGFAPAAKMTFSGISDPAARADMIAYLNQNASTQQKLQVAPSVAVAERNAPEFTLFGKTADVHPRLEGGKVASIDVTVALTAGELIDLLKNEYGNPKSFDYDGYMGGRHRMTYWPFSNGTSLSVIETISEGPMGRTGMDSTLRQYGIDPREYIRNHTSARYLSKSGTKDLLERAKGNTVDPSDT